MIMIDRIFNYKIASYCALSAGCSPAGSPYCGDPIVFCCVFLKNFNRVRSFVVEKLFYVNSSGRMKGSCRRKDDKAWLGGINGLWL